MRLAFGRGILIEQRAVFGHISVVLREEGTFDEVIVGNLLEAGILGGFAEMPARRSEVAFIVGHIAKAIAGRGRIVGVGSFGNLFKTGLGHAEIVVAECGKGQTEAMVVTLACEEFVLADGAVKTLRLFVVARIEGVGGAPVNQLRTKRGIRDLLQIIGHQLRSLFLSHRHGAEHRVTAGHRILSQTLESSFGLREHPVFIERLRPAEDLSGGLARILGI